MSEKIVVGLLVFGGVVLTQAVGYLISRQAANDVRANIDREIDIIRKLRPGTTEATLLEAHVSDSVAKLIYRDKRRQQLTDLFRSFAPLLLVLAAANGMEVWQQHGVPERLKVPVAVAYYTLLAAMVLFSVRYLWDLLKIAYLYTRTSMSFARFARARIRLLWMQGKLRFWSWWTQRKIDKLKAQTTKVTAIYEEFLDALEQATDNDDLDDDQLRAACRTAAENAVRQLAAIGLELPSRRGRRP